MCASGNAICIDASRPRVALHSAELSQNGSGRFLAQVQGAWLSGCP